MEQIMVSNKNNISRRMHRDSQTIYKPQVRIIHIFAPEIIKTDPANFRELVQRLTGKPSATREKMIRKRRKSAGKKTEREGDRSSSVEIVKSEEAAEIWRSSSSSAGSGYNESGGFLTGFADMEDGFMQQLGLFQPSLDLLPPQNHNPVLMHHHQQQQQHHFFGGEDHTHNRVV